MKTILKLFLPCVLVQFLWVSPLRAQTVAITGYDIILIAGQSNAVGYGRYETAAVPTDPNILEFACPPENRHGCTLDNRTLQMANDPLSHLDSQRVRAVGFGMSFAQAYRKQNPTRQVILVPAAIGSTSVLPYWDESAFKPANWRWLDPDGRDSNLYVKAVHSVRKAVEAAKAAGGGDVHFAAILWAQGESDIKNILCGDSVHSSVAPPPSGCTQLKLSAYKDELRKVIQGFRSDLPRSTGGEVPFLAVGASPSWVKSLKDAHDANPSNPPSPNISRR
jgi:hypothetical protein